jgi:probable F420-dependent oxidoreductase
MSAVTETSRGTRTPHQILRGRSSPIGIWSLELRFGDRGEAVEAAAELDELGFSALWIPGGVGGAVLSDVDRLIGATKRAVIATGILNIWKHEPSEVGEWWARLPEERRARALIGIGISHAPLIGETFSKPLGRTREYLEQLAAVGVPSSNLCVAALGPKMLELSRDTAGAHPYLVTPAHTAQARALLGPDKLVAPEQGVILERDPERARALARKALEHYLHLPNYVNNWRRLGFAEQDITGISDTFVDAIFLWGSVERIAKGVNAHLAAGADHVCLQVITGAGVSVAAARPAWRELASALIKT